MEKKIKNAKQLQKKSRSHQVRHVWGNMYQVVSGASGRTYYVRVKEDGATCDCKWGTRGGHKAKDRSGCSHVQAVYNYIESEKSRRISAWTDEEQARRQHRPMSDIGDGVVLTSRLATS